MAEWTNAPVCKTGAVRLRRFESFSQHFCRRSSVVEQLFCKQSVVSSSLTVGSMVEEKTPSVSVVIPAYNEEKYLPKCLSSVLGQNFDMSKVEIIVVDNNSTDRTPEIARSFGARVVKERKQGIAFTRQRGLLTAKGNVVACTDADAVVPKDWLKKIISHFEKNPRLVGIGRPGIFVDEKDEQVFPSIIYLVVGVFFKLLAKLKKPVFSGFNHSYKRKVFLEAGGYDTTREHTEDIGCGQLLTKYGEVIYDTTNVVMRSDRRLKRGKIKGILSDLIEFFPVVLFGKKSFGLENKRENYR